MPKRRIHGAFRQAKGEAGLRQRGLSVHRLRHSYATPLLQAGVNLRGIQQYLGHSPLETPRVYLHLTPTGQENA
jgi:site-specific recombinase XerD